MWRTLSRMGILHVCSQSKIRSSPYYFALGYIDPTSRGINIHRVQTKSLRLNFGLFTVIGPTPPWRTISSESSSIGDTGSFVSAQRAIATVLQRISRIKEHVGAFSRSRRTSLRCNPGYPVGPETWLEVRDWRHAIGTVSSAYGKIHECWPTAPSQIANHSRTAARGTRHHLMQRVCPFRCRRQSASARRYPRGRRA